MNKSGQAALEFLTTYGWAFLTIIIAIAALAYFGVFSPSKMLPERCSIAQEFACADFRISELTTGSQLRLDLAVTNQVGNSINIQDLVIDTNPAEITSATCNLPGTPVSPAGNANIDCTINGNFPVAGNKQKILFNIIYMKVGAQFNHSAGGELVGNIQQ